MVLNYASRTGAGGARVLVLLLLSHALSVTGCAASPADDRLRARPGVTRDAGGDSPEADSEDDFEDDEEADIDDARRSSRPDASAARPTDAGPRDAGDNSLDAGTDENGGADGRESDSAVAPAARPAAPAPASPATPVSPAPAPTPEPEPEPTASEPEDAGRTRSSAPASAAMCGSPFDCPSRSCPEFGSLPCCTTQRTCGCRSLGASCR